MTLGFWRQGRKVQLGLRNHRKLTLDFGDLFNWLSRTDVIGCQQVCHVLVEAFGSFPLAEKGYDFLKVQASLSHIRNICPSHLRFEMISPSSPNLGGDAVLC